MSTLDDPLMWGFRGFPSIVADLARWVLAAEDICFKNSLFSYVFRLGKCIPITRGGGIYHQHMNEALEQLLAKAWVKPENYMRGRRPPVPLFNKKISIIFGKPMEFDLPKLMKTAISLSCNFSPPLLGWPSTGGLDEPAQRCFYSAISKKIRTAMESLRTLGKSQMVQLQHSS